MVSLKSERQYPPVAGAPVAPAKEVLFFAMPGTYPTSLPRKDRIEAKYEIGEVLMNVAVIGGGPAGLMAAEVLSTGGAAVTVYDRMPSVGRKFLLAGRGGLNLTHSEPFERFLTRYAEAAPCLRSAIEAFSPNDLRAWCEGLGQETFIGSSGRVFPKAMKASPLLRAWLKRLASSNVIFKLRHCWMGWDEDGQAVFSTPEGRGAIGADAFVLALGGASWPKLGSDGFWAGAVAEAGLAVSPLRPANCGFSADWSDHFGGRFEGEPLKGIELRFRTHKVRGEAVITRTGLEGGAIYALSALLRDALAVQGPALVHIDLRPEVQVDALAERFALPRGKQSLATFLRKSARLSPVAIGLLHEAMLRQGTPLAEMTTAALAQLVKSVPVELTEPASITRAISTAGGIAFGELTGDFMLCRRPGHFVAGEMLDWEAPTGGYLLQACFATGAAAGRGALEWLRAIE
jgi:uncharacterized flavoprotein (TIGR03862 family)